MPGNRNLPFARTMDLATAQEISATCRSLAWLDYFADEERFVLDGLIGLNAGERSGDLHAHVRGLGLLAIVLSTFRALASAHRRADEGAAIAQANNDPALIADAALALGWIEFGTAPVDRCKTSLEQSASVFRSIGDIRGWAGATVYLYWVHYWLASLAVVTRTATEMVEIGEGAADPHVVCWGYNGLGVASAATGPLEEAVEHFSRARDLSVQITSYRFQAGIEGQLGKCRIRQGRLKEAATFLEAALRLIEAKNLRGMWSSDPLNGFAALWLARAARLPRAERRAALSEARRWCRRALRCTRHAVGWLAETQRLQGTLAWLSGESETANMHWRSSLTTADRGGMPLERARTLLEMGDRLGVAALIEEARHVFEQTGATVDLALCLHALARVAAASTDADAALRRYDQAIAALDAVNAEYNLGLASQERAQLLTKLGVHDGAQADLARARRCFATVGVDAEKIGE
jgi:tetratricopeptide (TPR) repeat protein